MTEPMEVFIVMMNDLPVSAALARRVADEEAKRLTKSYPKRHPHVKPTPRFHVLPVLFLHG